MMLPWMVYSVAVGLLLGIAALAGDAVLRQRERAARWVWAAAILATLALPAIAMLTPSLKPQPRSEGPVAGDARRTLDRFEPATQLMAAREVASIASPAFTALAPASSREASSFLAPPAPEDVLERGAASGAVLGAAIGATEWLLNSTWIDPSAMVPTRPAWDGPVLALWAISSVSVLLYLGVSIAGLRRRRRTWTRTMLDGRPVLVSRDTGPAVVGFVGGEVVVPEWLLESAPAEREMALAHEVEHLSRRDPLLLLFAMLACAAAPWNAAVWWMGWRLRRATEIDCDRRVLARGTDPRAYGRLLMAVTDRTTTGRFAICALSAPPSFLERRIRLMLENKYRWPRTRAAVALILVLGFTLAAYKLAEPEVLLANPVPPEPALLPAETAAAPTRESGETPLDQRGRGAGTRDQLAPSHVASMPVLDADTIPIEETLEELRRGLEAASAEMARLREDTTRERLFSDLREQLNATRSEIAAFRADTTRQRVMEVWRRSLAEESARLEQLRADTAVQRRLVEAEAALRSTTVATARQRAAVAAELEALRSRLEELRSREQVDSVRTQREAQLGSMLLALEATTASREAQRESSLRASRLEQVAVLNASLATLQNASASAQGLRSIEGCVVQNGQLRIFPESLTPANADRGSPPGYAADADWFRDETLTVDSRAYVKLDSAGSLRVIGPDLLQKVGEMYGTPVFAERGRVAPYEFVFLPVGPGCVFQTYRDREARP